MTEILNNSYNPLGKEKWSKIAKEWRSYKEDVGLEGELYFILHSDKSPLEEKQKVQKLLQERPENLKAWHQLRNIE